MRDSDDESWPHSALLVSAAVLLGVALLAPPLFGQEPPLRPGWSYFSLDSASDEATVWFGEHTVTVEDATPGGEMLWLTVWRVRVDHAWTHVVRDQGKALDEDGDGVVELEVEDRIPTLSVWALIDLASGSFDLVAPSPFRVRDLPVDLGSFRDGARTLRARGRGLDVLWLRPDGGIWQAQVDDGDANDLDRLRDRSLRFDGLAFESRGREVLGPPEELARGDVLLGIETESLRAFAAFVE